MSEMSLVQKPKWSTVQGDDHDFGRQDEVGAHSPADDLLFLFGTAFDRRSLFRMGTTESQLPQLLGTFVAQIQPADHKQGSEHPREELAEQHDRRQDEHQFVDDRPAGDFPHNGEFASRRKAVDIARGDRSIVNNNAGGFGRSTPGCSTDVIDGCGSCARQCDNVVKKGGKTTGHRRILTVGMRVRQILRALSARGAQQFARPRRPGLEWNAVCHQGRTYFDGHRTLGNAKGESRGTQRSAARPAQARRSRQARRVDRCRRDRCRP